MLTIFHTPHREFILDGLSYFSLSTFFLCINLSPSPGSYHLGFKYIRAIRHLEPSQRTESMRSTCFLTMEMSRQNILRTLSFWTDWMLWSISSNANMEIKACKQSKTISVSLISDLKCSPWVYVFINFRLRYLFIF